MALTADPIASLVDTAFIGQIGILSPHRHVWLHSVTLFSQIIIICVDVSISVTNLDCIIEFVMMHLVLKVIGPFRSSGACCCRSFHSSLQSSIANCNFSTCQCHNLFRGRGRYSQWSELASGRGEWMFGSRDTSGCWNQRVLTAEKYGFSTFLFLNLAEPSQTFERSWS